jgi:hypothetical protein
MSTITPVNGTTRNDRKDVRTEALFRDRIIAPTRLYVIVGVLLALAFAAIAIRGFAPALAIAASRSAGCRAADSDCGGGAPKAALPARFLPGDTVSRLRDSWQITAQVRQQSRVPTVISCADSHYQEQEI